MNSHTSVRVGIVGLGHIGRVHADRLVDRGVNLVGGVDVDPTARRRFAERYDVPAHERAGSLFDAADAVVVATPNRYHEEYATAALRRGLDVLVEKPLAHTLESAERIAAAAYAAEGRCMVGFQNRFATPVRALERCRREGRLGDVRHVEANYVRRRGVPAAGRSGFTDESVSGGGSLVDIGVHAIDLALHLLDFPRVLEVAATTRSAFVSPDAPAAGSAADGPGVDDSASAFVRCADGKTVSLEVAWATNRPADYTFTVGGTDAGARFDLTGSGLTLYGNDGSDRVRSADATAADRGAVDRIAAEHEAFLRTVADGGSPDRNTVEEGLAVQRVVDALYRSSSEGRAVPLAKSHATEPPVEIR